MIIVVEYHMAILVFERKEHLGSFPSKLIIGDLKHEAFQMMEERLVGLSNQ